MTNFKFQSRVFSLLGSVAIIVFGFVTSYAQYSETFSTPNKGYLLNCVNDFAGVPWFLTSWVADGGCTMAQARDTADYFSTTAAGTLESSDLDQEVCWYSPLLNISTAGTVTSSVDLTWATFDVDAAAGMCIGDYIRVSNSINGGAYTMVPNQFGGNACATVAYPLASTPPALGTGTVTQTGLSGTTLRTRVCVFTNTTAEVVTIDNVRVPHAGVSVLVTAAPASIAGRVTTGDGRGISGTAITVAGGSLSRPRTAKTSSFGYYSIEGLNPGETYIVTVGSKRFAFAVPSRVVSLTDSVSDLDFVADPF